MAFDIFRSGYLSGKATRSLLKSKWKMSGNYQRYSNAKLKEFPRSFRIGEHLGYHHRSYKVGSAGVGATGTGAHVANKKINERANERNSKKRQYVPVRHARTT